MDTTVQIPVFKDRVDAASRLAEALQHYKYSASLVMAGSCRAVLEGFIIAHTLGLPLDILLSGKIEPPPNPGHLLGIVTLVPTAIWLILIARALFQMSTRFGYVAEGKL